MNKHLSKPQIFWAPALDTARKIDDSEKVNMLSSAAYEFDASARDLTSAYEDQLAKLRQKYLDRVVSIHGEE